MEDLALLYLASRVRWLQSGMEAVCHIGFPMVPGDGRLFSMLCPVQVKSEAFYKKKSATLRSKNEADVLARTARNTFCLFVSFLA